MKIIENNDKEVSIKTATLPLTISGKNEPYPNLNSSPKPDPSKLVAEKSAEVFSSKAFTANVAELFSSKAVVKSDDE